MSHTPQHCELQEEYATYANSATDLSNEFFLLWKWEIKTEPIATEQTRHFS